MGNGRWRDLGRRVVNRRVELGWRTREAFVEVTGLSRKTLGEIERGDRDSYDPATIATIEQTLRWPLGAVAAVVSDDGPPDAPDRLSIDRHTGALLDPAGRELPAEIVDLIHFLDPVYGLDAEGREVAQKLLYGVVMTLAALAREQRKVRRLTGVEDPDVDLPHAPPDVAVVEPRASRETADRL